MKTSELLIAARAKIQNPDNWTQGLYMARREKPGGWAEPNRNIKEANCFCSVGALSAVLVEQHVTVGEPVDGDGTLLTYIFDSVTGTEPYKYLRRAIVTTDWNVSVIRFNDDHKHAEVLEMFDAAIKLAQEAGK